MGWKPVLLLAGYLVLVPPAFALGPLTGLLLLSRPRTLREWTWIIVAGGTSLLWLQRPGNLAGQVARAATVLLTGAYIALTVWRSAPGWMRAMQTVAVAGGALTVLMVWAGVEWHELHQSAASGFRSVERLIPPAYRAQTPALSEHLATLYPALLAVVGAIGVQLAWIWHCRLAERPIGKRFCTGERNL